MAKNVNIIKWNFKDITKNDYKVAGLFGEMGAF